MSVLLSFVVLAFGGPVRDARQGFDASVAPEAAVWAPGDGSVDHAVAWAVGHRPRVIAAHARWEAAVHAIAQARALPQPMVGLGVFVRSVETRVGPQQARVSLEQALPWPGGLAARGDAAALEAQAAGAALDDVALVVAAEVEAAYWALWRVRRELVLHADHQEVLAGLADSVRGRVEVGRADLADLQQLELARARLDDTVASLHAQERIAEARLRGAMGIDDATVALATSSSPAVAAVAEEAPALAARVRATPRLAAAALRAEAAEAARRAAGAARLPDLVVGADWVVTGDVVDPPMPVSDSGKDAVMARVGVRLPLWQGTVGHQVHAAEARARALDAERADGEALALAAFEQAWVEVEDSARRAELVGGTLLPQARAAYASLLGQVAAGTGTVAQVLLLQRDLLDLSLARARARAEHASAWARLEALVGGPVASVPSPEGDSAE